MINNTKNRIEINKIYNDDCLKGMEMMPGGSIDLILTDPPYKYLKGQKLERDFDEEKFFTECKRVLKRNGFLVFFGRGESFYRWNTICSSLGFTFKEEVIWDKRHISSPVLPLGRVHETIAVYTKGAGTINRVKVPYLDMRDEVYDSRLVNDIKRLCSALNNAKELRAMQDYLESRTLTFVESDKTGYYIAKGEGFKDTPRGLNTIRSIKEGLKETSIISLRREHYKTIHPTQKPVALIERLLALVSKEGDIVLDPFSGSASTALAAINTDRKFIGFEIDKEYYDGGNERIEAALGGLFTTTHQEHLTTK